MDRRIQQLTNLAFLLLCLVGVALGVRALFRPTAVLVPGGLNNLRAANPRPVAQPPVLYATGEAIAVESVDFTRADRTLLMVVRKGCRFCDESMPFYKRLGDDAMIAKRAQLVVVAPDDEAVSREELARQQIRVDHVVKRSLGLLKVRGTPTAIVVNKAGRVEKVMVGRLDEKQQQELMSALKGPAQP